MDNTFFVTDKNIFFSHKLITYVHFWNIWRIQSTKWIYSSDKLLFHGSLLDICMAIYVVSFNYFFFLLASLFLDNFVFIFCFLLLVKICERMKNKTYIFYLHFFSFWNAKLPFHVPYFLLVYVRLYACHLF